MFVVKIGGSLLKNGLQENLASDLESLIKRGEKIVLVHGGGDIVTEVATRMGKKQEFIVSPEGIRSRYTDRETVEIYTMVMTGLIRTKIVSELLRRGVESIGLSGIDLALMQAKRKKKLVVTDNRGRKILIDGGYTGTIKNVNEEFIREILNKKIVPVISPVAISEEFEPLNVDADRTASAISVSLRAEKLVFLTNVEGLYLDEVLVDRVNVQILKQRLKDIGFGMQKKVIASIEAIENGVASCVICSGLINKPITSAIDEITGTVIRNG